ncbi:MAG TPA: ankyrin repeat domain-containing protein [Pseudonocardiaceae bacterium]|nr:ankyrin repeat domain-containing protein [Pseudonocardiaceae bacterium]
MSTELAERVEEFLTASVNGRLGRAAVLLHADPAIAGYDVRTAVVLGDIQRVRAAVERDPALVNRPDERFGWPPLLAACSSRWHRVSREHADGLLAVARLLLDAGADANTTAAGRGGQGHCGTLYGAAGCAGNAAITRLLLERGARPDDHTVYLAAFAAPEHECLRLLLSVMDSLVESTALAAPISTDDIDGVRLLLDAGADPSRPLPGELFGEPAPDESPVAAAVRTDCQEGLIALLLARGGDPNVPGRDGRSPYRTVLRRGRAEIAALLIRHGVRDDSTPADRFLAACHRVDRAEAHRLAEADPAVVADLTDRDALLAAADRGDAGTVALMLDLGAPIDSRAGDDQATALHAAAGAGSAEVVRLLIARGADLTAPDGTWRSPALEWAIVGSGQHLGHDPNPDWPAVVRALVEAGAVVPSWGPDKPPSAEVAALLRDYGAEVLS